MQHRDCTGSGTFEKKFFEKLLKRVNATCIHYNVIFMLMTSKEFPLNIC